MSLLILLAGLAPAQDLEARPETEEPARRVQMALSPSGERIGWVEERGDVRRLLVAPVADPGSASVLTDDPAGVLDWLFLHTAEHVAFTRPVGEDVHLFLVPIEGGSVFDATPDAVGATRIAGHNFIWRHHVALDYQPQGEERGLWLLQVLPMFDRRGNVVGAAGERHRMAEGGFERYVFDHNMWPIGASGARGGEHVVVRMLESGVWEELRRLPAASTADVLCGDGNGDRLWFVDTPEEGPTRLMVFDVPTGEESVVAAGPIELAGAQVHPREQVPGSVMGEKRHLLEPGLAKSWSRIEATLGEGVEFIGQDLEGTRWLLRTESGGAARYHLHDVQGGGTVELPPSVPSGADEKAGTAPPPSSIPAR